MDAIGCSESEIVEKWFWASSKVVGGAADHRWATLADCQRRREVDVKPFFSDVLTPNSIRSLRTRPPPVIE